MNEERAGFERASAAQSAPDDVFEEGQWWLVELDSIVANGTPTQRRAMAVVRNLLSCWQRTQAAWVPEAKVTGAWESARNGDFNAGWNACRDSVFTLMKKAAYMELDTTKRSIAIQDELRALLASAEGVKDE